MQNLLFIGAGAALVGLLLGWLGGAITTGRKHRRQAEEVRGEMVRLRALAEDKLSGDDPEIDDLLGNLETAVTSAYEALQAMENQAKMTKRKSEGGREVVAWSKSIIAMIDEQTGTNDAPIEIVADKKAPRLTAQDEN